MRFQKCEGLEAETEAFEYQEGGGAVHKFKGRTRFPNIVLEKGIVDSDDLWKWYNKTAEGNVERQSGSIVLCNLQGEEIKRWNFFRAFPCRWIGPALNVMDRRTFAVERVEIAHEWLEVDGGEEEETENVNVVDSTQKINDKQLDKLIDEYLDDVEAKSGYKINKEQIKNKKFVKISSVENAEKRKEFKKLKKNLLSEWEEINGQEWPTYKQDIYDDKGILVRKTGMKYDAHHIHPLEMGGTNTAKNLTPISAENHYDHKGVHSPGSPFNELKNYLKEN